MRSIIPAIGVLLSLAVLRADPAPAQPQAADADIERVLRGLDDVGKHLQAFSAKLKLTETDNAFATPSTIRSGNVWFERRPDGSARIHVRFDWRTEEGSKFAHPEKKDYLLDGRWLLDRNYQTRQEIKREVLKPGQKMDLFKLGEGPFPLPIGQDPQDVRKSFDVKFIAPAKEDPPSTTHLDLIPRQGTDLARKFYSVSVWVDEKTHMPVRVDTLDAKKENTRSTELGGIVVNPPQGLKESDFRLPDVDPKQWNMRVESLNDSM